LEEEKISTERDKTTFEAEREKVFEVCNIPI
jgi:hypothetical protein